MAETKGIGTEKFLKSVVLPKQEKSGKGYTVISHGSIISKVKKELKKNGFEINKTEYNYSYNGQIARAKIYIKCDRDPDMGMLFVWQNSYNKMVKFGCAIGGYIYDNNTPMVGTEGLAWIRKHNGTADNEANNVIKNLIEDAEKHFQSAIKEKERMKALSLDVETYGCIMGALYFEHELITPNQASIVKNERKKPSFDYKDKDTLWGLYKLLMYGIEGADIRKWQKSQQKLHHMIMTEYAIATEDCLSIPEETPLQPGELRETDSPEVIPAVFVDNNSDQITAIEEGLDHKGDDVLVAEVDFEDDGRPIATPEEPVDNTPEITGIPNGDTISDTDDNVDEIEEEEIDKVLDSIFEGSELSPGENKEALEVLEQIEEPVKILNPEDVKHSEETIEETFKFPTDLDNTEKLNSEIIKDKIEERMVLLYSEVKSYKTENYKNFINVTITDTQEGFYIEN